MNKWIAICIALGSAFHTPLLQAQTWPQRPVKVVVPFAAGGSTDSQARIVSDRLSAVFGQQFLVDRLASGRATVNLEPLFKSGQCGIEDPVFRDVVPITPTLEVFAQLHDFF